MALPAISILNRVTQNLLELPAQTTIGGILVQTSFEELHGDKLEVTEHPVESGAAISDHSFKRPSDLMLRCGWSNSSDDSQGSFSSGFFVGGSMQASDFISGIYSQLLALQQSRKLFEVVTLIRKYNFMLMTSLELTKDSHSAFALMIEATFHELILTSTSSASLPAMASQKSPKDTAEVQNVGTQTAAPATPAPGGSLPPSRWGASSPFGSAHITP